MEFGVASIQLGSAARGDIAGVVSGTTEVIGELQQSAVGAKKRMGDPPKFDTQLDEAGRGAKEDFDSKRYAEMTSNYAEVARRISENVEQCLASTNVTVARELSDEAETALSKMTKAGNEIDSMEEKLRANLRSALN